MQTRQYLIISIPFQSATTIKLNKKNGVYDGDKLSKIDIIISRSSVILKRFRPLFICEAMDMADTKPLFLKSHTITKKKIVNISLLSIYLSMDN